MKNKRTILTILLSFLAGGVLTFGGLFLYLRPFMVQNHDDRQNLAKIATVYRQIDHNYYRKVNGDKLTTGAINGMLGTLGDPFSDYLSGSDATSLNNTIAGSFSGVGIQVAKHGEYIQIMSTIKGTPAQKAGLKAGDKIAAVNHKSLKNKPISDAVDQMRGKNGTEVSLTIIRGNNTFEQKLKRAKIPVTTVNSKMIKDTKVGYISISTVSQNTAAELKDSLKELQKDGAKSLVIDVRNNPGGLMDQALKMSSMFLKNGKTIMQVQSRGSDPEVFKASEKLDGGYKVKIPTAVLINGESASAAEIFAAALHQSADIPLVGSQSYGKGTVQNIADYGSGSELKLTIARWLTPDGSWINKKGITPTYKADYPKMAYLPPFSEHEYKKGAINNEIKNYGVALQDLGYLDDQPTSEYNDKLVKAVSDFQKQNSLSQTGNIDHKTTAKIEASVIKELAKKDPALNKATKIMEEK